MYAWENNILTISSLPVPAADYSNKVSNAYKSYQSYIFGRGEGSFEDDLFKVMTQQLNEITKQKIHIKKNALNGKTFEIVLHYDDPYFRTSYYEVYAMVGNFATADNFRKCKILDMPYITEEGVFQHMNYEKSITAVLVRDSSVTFDYNKKELHIGTRNEVVLSDPKKCELVIKQLIDGNSERPARSLYLVIGAMAKGQGMSTAEAIEFVRRLKSREAVEAISKYSKNKSLGDTELGDAIEAEEAYFKKPSIDKYKGMTLYDILASADMDISKSRSSINEYCSIDRALNYKLAMSIKFDASSDKSDYPVGTVVTGPVLEDLKRHYINEVHVFLETTLQGAVLAVSVDIPIVRQGSRNLHLIREWDAIPLIEESPYIPYNVDYRSMEQCTDFGLDFNSSNQYKYGKGLIPAGTVLDKSLIEFLAYNGHESVCIESTGKSFIEVPLYVDVIGNNTYKRCEVGLDGVSEEWVSLDGNGAICECSKYLTADDFLSLASVYRWACDDKVGAIIPDMDTGLRKRVKLIGEITHECLPKAVKKHFAEIKGKLNAAEKKNYNTLFMDDEFDTLMIGCGYKVRSAIDETKVLQAIDCTNPVDYNSCLTRVSTITKSANSVSAGMRALAMGHFGRICPYETPQSKKMGLTNNISMGCVVEDSILKAVFLKLRRVKNADGSIDLYLTDEKVALSIEEQEKHRICDILSLEVDPATNRILNSNDKVLALAPSIADPEKTSSTYIDIKYADLATSEPNFGCSVTASTIPFIGHDDSTRVSFGLNMCKQAKGLVDPDIPRILTKAFRDIPLLNNKFLCVANRDGTVENVTTNSVTVRYDDNDEICTYKGDLVEINEQSIIFRNLLVTVGQRVMAGTKLIESSFIKNGYLATGKNVLVAVCPIGYNYEDGCFVSERLSSKLVSYGTHVVKLKNGRKKEIRITENIQPLKYKEQGEPLIKYINSKNSVISTLPSEDATGYFITSSPKKDRKTRKVHEFRLTYVSIDELRAGDKLANRHGNKGVVPKLAPNNSMLYLNNGEFFDMVYNPCGIISRMNIGQVVEMHAGLAAHVLDIYVMSDGFNGASKTEVKKLLDFAYKLANSGEHFDDILHCYDYPEDMLKAISANKIWIQSWADTFDADGTAEVYDPKSATKLSERVVVGINYTYKLIHVSEKKISQRGGFFSEDYLVLSDAPPSGKESHGGQRMGTMEVEALIAHGASHLVNTFQNERSDNAVRRNNLHAKAIFRLKDPNTLGKRFVLGYTKLDKTYNPYIVPERQAVKRANEEFMHKFEALGVHVDFTEGEVLNIGTADYLTRKTYTKTKMIISPKTHAEDEQVQSDKVDWSIACSTQKGTLKGGNNL